MATQAMTQVSHLPAPQAPSYDEQDSLETADQCPHCQHPLSSDDEAALAREGGGGGGEFGRQLEVGALYVRGYGEWSRGATGGSWVGRKMGWKKCGRKIIRPGLKKSGSVGKV